MVFFFYLLVQLLSSEYTEDTMEVTNQLKDDIEVLLENSKFSVGYVYLAKGNQQKNIPQGVFSTLAENPDNYELIHDQAVALAKLYRQSSLGNQKKINNEITGQLEAGGETVKTAGRFFLLTGQMPYLLAYVFTNLKSYGNESLILALEEVNHYLLYQWHQVGSAEIRTIRKWAGDYITTKSALGKDADRYTGLYVDLTRLVEALYKQSNLCLSRDIKRRIDTGYNPEINVDKDILKREFNTFGFPADLSETLDKIDGKFSSARDAFDFKGCMDLIRAFTERLYRSILDSYAEEGRVVDEKDSEKVAEFFLKKGLVSDHFANMIAQLRHFLSDNASHRLKSREEDARLSKNMVIEMSLYLLRRYENH